MSSVSSVSTKHSWHSTVNWPIVIQDASLLCDRCGEPICGSGRGTLAILSRLVTDHQERRHSDPPESATRRRGPNLNSWA